MQIKKLCHSCVLVETEQGRLLVDPGNLSIAAHQDLTDISVILYTHEHGDHLHIESLQRLLVNNPKARIVGNHAVGQHISAAGYASEPIADGDEREVAGFILRAFTSPHAEIYEDFGQVEHTGYLVDERLFLAGDSFAVPPFAIEILAPAIVAPFCGIRDVVDMLKVVKPQTILTMHDGQLNEFGRTTWYGLLERLLVDEPVEMVPFPAGARFSVD